MMWFLSLAFAGDLELERAKRAMAEGRPPEAAALFREAIETEPNRFEGWVNWLTVCEVMGTGVACRAEAALLEDEAAPTAALLWHERAMKRTQYAPREALPERLAALDEGLFDGAPNAFARTERLRKLIEKDPDAAAELALSYLSEQPDHPEVTAPLFHPGVAPRKSIGKARKKILKVGSKRIDSADVPELYRWHTVFLGAPGGASERTQQRLVEAGEASPLDRYPYTRAEQVLAARRLLEADAVELPTHVPAEREGVMLKLAELLVSTGRAGEIDNAFTLARSESDSISLALAHGQVLFENGSQDRALAVSSEALELAVSPWPTDVTATQRLGRRDAVSKALVLRGRVRLAQGDVTNAAIDLIVANQLSLRPIGTDALERAMKTGRYNLEAIKARLDTPAKPAQQVALEAAKKALEEGRFDDVNAHASDAIAALCVPSHSKARLTARLAGLPELASAYALRGLAAAENGEAQVALTEISVATLLVPWSSPSDWWQLRADTQNELEHEFAGFFSASMAASLDDDTEVPSTSLWAGGTGSAAGAALVSEWVRGHEDLEAPKDRPVVQRGRVIPFRAPSSSGGGGSSRPSLNAPFPRWSVETPYGTAAPAPGRMHLISFFLADSPSSIRLMDELTGLARTLRGRGADIVLVGISIDPERSTLDALGGKLEQWGTVGWDPGMGQRFGVTAVPTTWVVDSEGVARFQHVGYLGTSEYEAEIRFISGL